MENPFETISRRLSNIEDLLLDLKHKPSPITDADPFGDFKWLSTLCKNVPESTLRIKSASGEIPGVVKFGKRVLYEKAIVLDWLRSQTRAATNATVLDRAAEAQFAAQQQRRGGRKAA